MNKQTELPWTVGGTYKREVRCAAFDPVADAWPISGITIDGAIDNAAFIVQACNEHYKQKELNTQLLEALKSAADELAFLVNHVDIGGVYDRVQLEVVEAREAIKQAEADDE